MAAHSPTEPKQPAVVLTDDERKRECSQASHPFVWAVTDAGLEPITVVGACVLDRTWSCSPTPNHNSPSARGRDSPLVKVEMVQEA